MAIEDFRLEARALLARMLSEAPAHINREALLDLYAGELVQLYGRHAHQVLGEILQDTRTRLDARLAPDPVQQTLANVQTTAQDLWNIFFGPPPPPPPDAPKQ